MRKFIFILLLIPIFVSLGHDVYFYTQEPDKGFRLSALGTLWDKYHKESHDEWKSTVRDMTKKVGDTVDDLTPEEIKNIKLPEQITGEPAQTETETAPEEKPDFSEGFTMIDEEPPGVGQKMMPLQEEEIADQRANSLIKFIGFVLEQKAALVFAVLALIAYLLNAICVALFTKKEGSDLKKIKKHKRKGGGYGYSRK